MIFRWICGGESGLPVLFLRHLSSSLEFFSMSQFFKSGGQSIGASAPASVLPMNNQGWFPLGLTGLISSLSKGISRVFSNTIIWKQQFFSTQPFLSLLKKTVALLLWTFMVKVMSLLFTMLSRCVIAFLPRSKSLLISWLQSPSAVILEPPKINYLTVSNVSPSICHGVMGPDAMILVFWMLSFKLAFSLSFFTFIKRLFISPHFLPLEWHHLHIWSY